MPKPSLKEEDALLERDIIETMLAGLKEWRPDLHYPESHSDLQGCVRALLRMYEVKRRPLARPLRLKCDTCDGIGHHVISADTGSRELKTCKDCNGRGWTPET